MKRIVSLDFMRGFAIMMMMAFHVLIHVSYHAQASNYSNLSAMAAAGVLPLFVLVFILANFRGLFLMVSMVVHAYVLTKTMPKGNQGILLAKNLIFALLLTFAAWIAEGVTTNWGIIGRSIAVNRWAPEAIHHMLHFEALNSIAVSIAFISLLFFIFAKIRIIGDKRKVLWILSIMGILFVVIHAIVQPIIEQTWPTYYDGFRISADPANNHFGDQYAFSTAGEFILKLILAPFIGLEQPILPFMSVTCIGGVIGYLLARQDVSRRLPRNGMIIGLLMMVAGIVILVVGIMFFDMEFSVEFHVFPTWFFLTITGLELFLLMLLLRIVEFSKKTSSPERMQRFIKNTVLFRRWGMVSLTLFVLQFLPEIFMRFLGNFVTGGQIEFMERGQADAIPSIIMILVVIVVWDLIFRLWERIKFKGTFEWLMSTISAKIIGVKAKEAGDPKERMQIEEVLYHPEPITFRK